MRVDKMEDEREVVSERDILIELLELYRDLPGLWDPNHEFYSNKHARHVAFKTLLECYHKFDKSARLGDVKRKLENMRSTYRREKKKVNKSIADENEATIHVPTLWYYPYLSFLDEDSDPFTLTAEHCNDSDNRSDEPDRKRPRKISKFNADQLLKRQIDLIDSAKTILASGEESSADTFGTSISSQLKELSKLQRCLAEKLIGEILFYAKMDQLNMNTVVYLNDGDGDES